MELLVQCLMGLSAFSPLLPTDIKPADLVAEPPPAKTVEILFFEADWCGPCETVRPVVERLNREGFPIQTIDVDQQRELVQKHKISGIPSFVAVFKGREINRLVGASSHDKLQQFCIDSYHTAAGSMRPKPVEKAAEASDLPGAVHVESLLRVTYELPKEKAEALVDFLKEQSTADFDAKIEDGMLLLTATPDVQRALAPFIETVLKEKE